MDLWEREVSRITSRVGLHCWVNREQGVKTPFGRKCHCYVLEYLLAGAREPSM